MSDSFDKEKLIIKTNYLNGGDLSIIDYGYAHSIPEVWTKVVRPIRVKNMTAFIGLKRYILPREVIQVGFNGTKYRIIRESRKIQEGYEYKIKRVDGSPITYADIANVQVGQNVKLASRRSKKNIFNQIYKALNWEY
jgi:hypothetical protein